jgi:hypothetical protein
MSIHQHSSSTTTGVRRRSDAEPQPEQKQRRAAPADDRSKGTLQYLAATIEHMEPVVGVGMKKTDIFSDCSLGREHRPNAGEATGGVPIIFQLAQQQNDEKRIIICNSDDYLPTPGSRIAVEPASTGPSFYGSAVNGAGGNVSTWFPSEVKQRDWSGFTGWCIQMLLHCHHRCLSSNSSCLAR